MAPEKVSVPVLHDYRGQFAGWSQALLHRHHDSLTTTGLTFRVRILEVKGSAPNSWRGLLLVIYEHRYGVVFHDLKDIDANKPLRGEFIWKAIRQAVRRLSTGRWPYFKLDAKPPPKVTIALPVGYGGKPVHPLLDEALACQGDRELTSWRVETYPGLKPTVLKINDLSFSQLDRMLRHHSRKVSSVLRSLSPGKRRRSEEKESGARGPDRPAWLLLFPDEYPYDFRRKS